LLPSSLTGVAGSDLIMHLLSLLEGTLQEALDVLRCACRLIGLLCRINKDLANVAVDAGATRSLPRVLGLLDGDVASGEAACAAARGLSIGGSVGPWPEGAIGVLKIMQAHPPSHN